MHQSIVELTLPDEAATLRLGQRLARALRTTPLAQPLVIYLVGELGAGKTALARSLLRALGVTSTIRSPTYTLLEIYDADGITCAHLDLYRLAAPGELEQLGLRELLEPGHLWLVEWPDKGRGMLPAPDLTLQLTIEGRGRIATLTPGSTAGAARVASLAAAS